jgi:hypothetical protein
LFVHFFTKPIPKITQKLGGVYFGVLVHIKYYTLYFPLPLLKSFFFCSPFPIEESTSSEHSMADDLFGGLPPPSSITQSQPQLPILSVSTNTESSSSVPSAPKPILKSSLKRPNPTQSDNSQGTYIISFFLFQQFTLHLSLS